jgi:hypothetical protein
VPKGVVRLISALQFHEITLQNPRSIWMAIGEKDRKPRENPCEPLLGGALGGRVAMQASGRSKAHRS